MEISYEAADTLVITFADEDLFKSEEGLLKILPEKRTLRRKLMRQLKAGTEETQASINTSSADTRMFTDYILFFNFMFGVGLKYLFEMMRAL